MQLCALILWNSLEVVFIRITVFVSINAISVQLYQRIQALIFRFGQFQSIHQMSDMGERITSWKKLYCHSFISV